MKFCRILFVSVALMSACLASQYTDALRRAAEQGDVGSQVMLASFYETGIGVLKDQAEAVKWLRKAAEQGDVSAQFILACHYNSGTGVLKDQAEAVKWFHKAAEQGHVMAQEALGRAYSLGEGALKDIVEAHAWLNISCIGGDKHTLGLRDQMEKNMAKEQIAEATKRAKELMAKIKKPE